MHFWFTRTFFRVPLFPVSPLANRKSHGGKSPNFLFDFINSSVCVFQFFASRVAKVASMERRQLTNFSAHSWKVSSSRWVGVCRVFMRKVNNFFSHSHRMHCNEIKFCAEMQVKVESRLLGGKRRKIGSTFFVVRQQQLEN